MSRIGWLIVFIAAALAALAGGIYLARSTAAAPVEAGTLFAISMPDLEGTEQALAQWRGKVVVVNWWATWCVPCREEMPRFVQAQQDLGGRGLQFVGVAVDGPGAVAAFAKELALNYPVLIGGAGALELSRMYGNRLMALPYTVIIDRHGVIAHTQLGPLSEASMRAIFAKLL